MYSLLYANYTLNLLDKHTHALMHSHSVNSPKTLSWNYH